MQIERRNGNPEPMVLSTTIAEEQAVSNHSAVCRDMLKRALQATHAWGVAAVNARTALLATESVQSPAIGQGLIGAWLAAAIGGHDVSAVTERHHRKTSEGRTPESAESRRR